MTPQAHIAALKQLHVSIGFESNKLAGVLSTVTVPDDAAAKISISGVIKDALSRPPESWADLEDGAEAEEELSALLRRKEAMGLLPTGRVDGRCGSHRNRRTGRGDEDRRSCDSHCC